MKHLYSNNLISTKAAQLSVSDTADITPCSSTSHIASSPASKIMPCTTNSSHQMPSTTVVPVNIWNIISNNCLKSSS